MGQRAEGGRRECGKSEDGQREWTGAGKEDGFLEQAQIAKTSKVSREMIWRVCQSGLCGLEVMAEACVVRESNWDQAVMRFTIGDWGGVWWVGAAGHPAVVSWLVRE